MTRSEGRELLLPDLAATERLGATLAALLRPGDAILLEGPLGAGKTALSRALIRAALADPTLEVPSPSYTLVQTYHAPALTLHHLDLWRLDGPAALHELGWDEMRADVVLVEWPERLGALSPLDALAISLRLLGGFDHRQVILRGWGERIPAQLDLATQFR